MHQKTGENLRTVIDLTEWYQLRTVRAYYHNSGAQCFEVPGNFENCLHQKTGGHLRTVIGLIEWYLTEWYQLRTVHAYYHNSGAQCFEVGVELELTNKYSIITIKKTVLPRIVVSENSISSSLRSFSITSEVTKLNEHLAN